MKHKFSHLSKHKKQFALASLIAFLLSGCFPVYVQSPPQVIYRNVYVPVPQNHASQVDSRAMDELIWCLQTKSNVPRCQQLRKGSLR